MPLSAGTELGTYEVLSAIGAGGMGEVYQAHDSELGRDVAIKVLPEQFARDPERLAADPTLRLISSQRIWDRGAALTSTLQWFETELLTK